MLAHFLIYLEDIVEYHSSSPLLGFEDTLGLSMQVVEKDCDDGSIKLWLVVPSSQVPEAGDGEKHDAGV